AGPRDRLVPRNKICQRQGRYSGGAQPTPWYPRPASLEPASAPEIRPCRPRQQHEHSPPSASAPVTCYSHRCPDPDQRAERVLLLPSLPPRTYRCLPVCYHVGVKFYVISTD